MKTSATTLRIQKKKLFNKVIATLYDLDEESIRLSDSVRQDIARAIATTKKAKFNFVFKERGAIHTFTSTTETIHREY